MKLPVGIIQASLEMVRLRIAQQFPSEAVVIAQVIDALNPTANALRQRKHRAKPVTQTSVTSNASSNEPSNASEPSCASRAASESQSPAESSEIHAEKREENPEERERAREPRNAFVTPRVTPQVTPEEESANHHLCSRLWAEWCGALNLISGGTPNYSGLAQCMPALAADDVATACRRFRAAADAYVADCGKRGQRPKFHFFAKDFTDWLAMPASGASAGSLPPARKLLNPRRQEPAS